MKQLLFALCLVVLIFSMSVELEQPRTGSIKYTVIERGALNSTLHLVVTKGDVQHSVFTIEGFNGLYSGEFFIVAPGDYTVKAYNLDTGNTAQAAIKISVPGVVPSGETPIEKIEEQFAEQSAAIREEPEQMAWVPYLIVVLVVVIAALLLFGNPLKKPKKKK